MNPSDMNQFLSEPLIPAIAIVVILVVVFLLYKFQQYRESQKPMSQVVIPLVDENIKKRRPQPDSAPLVVPNSKSQGLTSESKPSVLSPPPELDDDLADKPLFPTHSVAPVASTDKSCEDLYKELLDPDKFDEALYKELLDGPDSTESPQPIVTTSEKKKSPSTVTENRGKPEAESDLILSEIEKEFLELEKDFHIESEHEQNPYSTNYDAIASLDDETYLLESDKPAEPSEEVSVHDLQQEMEDTIAKLSQHLVDQNPEDFKTVKPEAKVEFPVPQKTDTTEVKKSETTKNQDLETKPPTKSKPASNEDSPPNHQYIQRLKSFQTNLEQRFGSLNVANDPKSSDNDSLVDKVSYSASSAKSKSSKDSLDLLESFLFTASQKNKK